MSPASRCASTAVSPPREPVNPTVDPSAAPDHLDGERFSPLEGSPLVLIDLAEAGAEARAARLAASRAAVIGVDRLGSAPALDVGPFDGLLSTAADPPPPYTGVRMEALTGRLARIDATARTAPIATALLARLLRSQADTTPAEALMMESLAYSTLLGGGEFATWLNARSASPPAATPDQPLAMQRDAQSWTIRLSSPGTRNAMTAVMRDALFDALAMVLDDPTEPNLRLEAEGACFSIGGDLAEFGSATDLARAHVIRTSRSCAELLMKLGDRATVRLHGACIGSGLEIPVAAGHRSARANAFFQLPELTMGLIPGAGGTVTLGRAIGRHRTFIMAITAQRVRAREALALGLIDRIEDD